MYCSDSSGFPKIRIESESIWYAVIEALCVDHGQCQLPCGQDRGNFIVRESRFSNAGFESCIGIACICSNLYDLATERGGGTPSSTFGRLEKMLVRDYIHHGILIRYNWNSVNCRYDTLLCSFTVGKSNDSLVSAGGVCVIHTVGPSTGR